MTGPFHTTNRGGPLSGPAAAIQSATAGVAEFLQRIRRHYRTRTFY